jgi:hypothetical protein
MATELEPIVGDWYSYRGRDFTVIDVDEDEGIVEIQYASGTVQQVDFKAWYKMDLEPSEEPEDWNSDLEDVDQDDGEPGGRSRWAAEDEDDEAAIADEDEDDDVDDDDDEDDDDWDDESDEEDEEDEWEEDYRDRRSDDDDSWDAN